MTIGKQSGIAEYYVLAGGMKNVYGSDPDHGYAPLNGVEGVDVVIAPKGIVLYIPVNVPFDPQPVTVTYASKEIYYGEFSEQTPAKTDFYQGAATATNPMPEGYAASDWVGVKANAWHKSALNVQDGGLVNAGTYDEVISVGLKQLPEVEDHWYTFTAANTSTGKCNVGGTLTVNPCPIKNDWQDGSKTYDGQPHTEIIHPYQTVGNRIPYTLPYGQSFGGIGSVTVKKNGQAVAGLYEYDALTGKGTVSMTDIGVYTIEISITNPNYTKAPDAVMSITYTIYPKRAEAMIAPQEHIYDPMITYTLPELNTGHAPLVTVLGSDRYLNWEADGTGEFKILSIRRNGVPRNIHEVGDYEVLVQLTNEAASAYVLINPDTNQPWSNGIAVLPYSVRHVIVSVVWDFPNGQAYDYGDRPPLPLVKNQNGDILTLGKEYEIVVTGGDNNTSITINGPAGWNEDSLEALGDYGMEVRLKDPVNYKFGNTEPTHSFTVVAAKIPAPWLNDEFVYSEISGLYETSSISRGGVLTQKDVHWDLSHVRPADLDGWDVDVSVTAVVWPFPFEFTATSPIENVGEYRVEVTLKKSGYVFAFGAGDAREVAGSNGKSAWFIIKINKKVVFPEQIVEGPYNEGELPPEFKEPGDLVNVPDIPKECYEVKVYDKDDENNETERDLAYVNDNPGEYKVVITIICPNYTFPDDEVTVEYEFEIKEKKSEEASSEETTTEEASSEEASSEEVSSEAASSEEVSSEAASSEEVSSEAVSSEEVSSEAASSEEASSEAVSSSEEASSEEASGETPTPTPSPKPTPSPAPTATATIRPPVRPTVIVINPVPTQRPTVRPTTGTWPPNNATQRPTTRPTARPTSALADAFGRVSPGRDSTLSLADDLVPLAGMIRWLTWFEEKSAGWIVSGDAVLYVSEENGVLSALQAIDISPYLDPPRNWFSETLIVVPSEDGRVMMIAVWDELQQKTTQAILLLDTATMEFVRITGTKGVERFDLSLSGRYAAYIQNDTLHVVDVTEAKIFSNMIAVETVEGVKQETDGILLNCLSFGLADTLLIYVDEANASHTGTWLDFVEGVYYQAPADRTYPLAQPTNEYVELYVIQGAGGAELRLTEANADQAKLEERYLLTHNPAKKDFYQWLRRQPREKKTYSSE
ncbi:MAG: hypothetical protein FWF69_03550 [Firmicutes bacterium]|nr:hypothetical protein [Bacillota bacterium]